MVGTPGFVDPAYVRSGIADATADVYRSGLMARGVAGGMSFKVRDICTATPVATDAVLLGPLVSGCVED